ncbi:putative non-specific serine/threonine protein kinase [Helianthus anomalus]
MQIICFSEEISFKKVFASSSPNRYGSPTSKHFKPLLTKHTDITKPEHLSSTSLFLLPLPLTSSSLTTTVAPPPPSSQLRLFPTIIRYMQHKSPSLCSICQDKAHMFGAQPKWFSFNELEDTTNGFSKANFLAEGGFGSVHRGVLKYGRMVAVKQHKLASFQGENEFFLEVEVLCRGWPTVACL